MKPSSLPLYLTPDAARDGLDLVMSAHRKLLEAGDEALKAHGFGRAHHRALRAIARSPGETVSGLLDRLGITKQSLSRVLLALRQNKLIAISQGRVDRRQKQLRLTVEGQAVLDDVESQQRAFIVDAYLASGADAVAGFRFVLTNVVSGHSPTGEPGAQRDKAGMQSRDRLAGASDRAARNLDLKTE